LCGGTGAFLAFCKTKIIFDYSIIKFRVFLFCSKLQLFLVNMFLKNLNGKTVVLEPTLVALTTTVRELKDVVEAQEGILSGEQRLSYAGKFLK